MYNKYYYNCSDTHKYKHICIDIHSYIDQSMADNPGCKCLMQRISLRASQDNARFLRRDTYKSLKLETRLQTNQKKKGGEPLSSHNRYDFLYFY